jgi:catechol 2,3-dioxygenase-like lactoylglutathione lyase family enzyme
VSDLISLVAFVPSADLDRSRTFYRDVLGLPVEEFNSFACVMRSGEVMLRVTRVDGLTPQSFTVLGWQVSDIGHCVAELAAKGVVFEHFDGMGQDATGVWSTPDGSKVVWFKDPDGNTLSLTQFADPGH